MVEQEGKALETGRLSVGWIWGAARPYCPKEGPQGQAEDGAGGHPE